MTSFALYFSDFKSISCTKPFTNNIQAASVYTDNLHNRASCIFSKSQSDELNHKMEILVKIFANARRKKSLPRTLCICLLQVPQNMFQEAAG